MFRSAGATAALKNNQRLPERSTRSSSLWEASAPASIHAARRLLFVSSQCRHFHFQINYSGGSSINTSLEEGGDSGLVERAACAKLTCTGGEMVMHAMTRCPNGQMYLFLLSWRDSQVNT